MRPYISVCLLAMACVACRTSSPSRDKNAEIARSKSETDGQFSDDQLALKGGGGGGGGTTTTRTKTYTMYSTGNSANVSPAVSGGLLLVGGGLDRDDAMQWFVDCAGRGDIVILRASGADGYNTYLVGKGADSVDSIVFASARASTDTVILEKIRNAEGIFFAGGDQSLYVSYWKDTPIETEVNAAAARGAVIGGTSAGLAILGEYLYPAINASAVSSTALANPFDASVMIDRDFLLMPRLNRLITDSHFGARDRMGRLVTFMARIVQAGWASSVNGLGVDEQTAMAIDNQGVGRVFADTGKVYVLTSTVAPAVCTANTPLAFTGIRTIRLPVGSTFDFATGTATGGTSYELNANAGVLTSTTGAIY